MLVELGIVVTLQHELHRRSGAAAKTGLEGADHHIGNAGELGTQRAGELGGGDVALGPVGELDDHHTGLIAATAKGGGAEAQRLHHSFTQHRHDGGLHLLHVALHPLDAGPLRPLDEDIDDAAILGRGKAGRQLGKEGTDTAQTEQQHQRRPAGATQHPRQQVAIVPLQPAEPAIEPGGEPVRFIQRAHQPGAHGRGQGQRHQRGAEHRKRKQNRKLGKEPPHHAIHKGDGDKHHHQHGGGGDDRKAHFPGAVPGGQQGRFPPLQMVVDVLHHHDGIIHHQADGKDQRQQGDEVDGKAEIPGADKGGDERYRHRNGRNERGAPLPEEQIEHRHHQHGADGQGLVHLVDRLLDKDGGVVIHLELGPLRQEALHLAEFLLDPLRHCQRVGGGLGDDADTQALFAVALIGAVFVLGSHLHVGDIGQIDALAVGGCGDLQLLEIFRCVVETGDLHRHGHGVVADLAPRQLDVLPLESLFHIAHRDATGRHVGRAQPHIHHLGEIAGERHFAHPVHQTQGVDQHAVGVVGHGGAIHLAAAEVEPDRHIAVAAVLGHQRLVHIIGQLALGTGKGISHIGDPLHHVPAELELDGDHRAPLAGHGVDVLDAADAGELILDGLGDLTLHHRGGRPLIGSGDGDRGDLHVRHLPHRQFAERDQTKHGEQGAEHHRHQRAAN